MQKYLKSIFIPLNESTRLKVIGMIVLVSVGIGSMVITTIAIFAISSSLHVSPLSMTPALTRTDDAEVGDDINDDASVSQESMFAITSPVDGAVIEAKSGQQSVIVNVTGTASGSNLKEVLAFVGEYPYKKVEASSPGNWSIWSYSDTVTSSGTVNIVAKAIDNKGKEIWAPITINVIFPATESPEEGSTKPIDVGRRVHDPNLAWEVVFKGLEEPTSMAFVGLNDILVLEKNKGTVQRILNGNILSEPVFDVNVANENERGLLGIAVANNSESSRPTYVFLTFTETEIEGSDECPTPNNCMPGGEPLGNRLYRYEWLDGKLTNPKLLLDVPASPGPAHNGGKVIIGPDNNVYVVIGDVLIGDYAGAGTQAQNYPEGVAPLGTAGILRLTQDGLPANENGILGSTHPINLYYAYGIRNSFGIDFDPITGVLWDTENGPSFGDEINRVEPGFNSGWRKIQGVWITNGFAPFNFTESPEGLENFDGRGAYSSPELTWRQIVGPTAVKFLDSTIYGEQYQNDLFVAGFHSGKVYHFDFNKDRTELALNGVLADKLVDTPEELDSVVFAEGVRDITDLQIGPDGYLYVLSHAGSIYRIVLDT